MPASLFWEVCLSWTGRQFLHRSLGVRKKPLRQFLHRSLGVLKKLLRQLLHRSLEVLKKNLARIGERAEVLNLGYEVCLARVTGQFDLVFADPPYACDYLPDVGARLAARGLLAEGGLLVYESEHKGLPAPEGLIKTDERGYGRTYLAFFGRTV